MQTLLVMTANRSGIKVQGMTISALNFLFLSALNPLQFMKHRRRNLVLWLVSFVIGSLLSIPASAQDEVLESTNPPSVKWKQINTQHFRVIFPSGFDVQGQRVANTLEFIHDPEAKSLGSSPRKISVILQNQSSVSNAFVSILPRRSEFYTMPSQDYNFLGTNDWLDLLASHEYRHIVQYQHATRGFNRLFYYLFGAPTLAGMAQVAAPQWFWEGDAVATETAFTRSGRGKIPNFNLLFKTNLLEGRTFNYHKQYLRSYKHFIPDHYVLGYNMVSYLRKKTNDPQIWGKITARSWNVPFIPFAFSNAIKKESGRYVTRLYKEMAGDLRSQWQADINKLQLTSFDRMDVNRRRAYTDYSFPQPTDAGVIVIKSGIGNIQEFVFADKNHGHIFTPGYVNDSGMISAQGSLVAWTEYGYDPRWTVKNYSLIKVYSLETRKRYVIGGRKTRYTSAAVSPDEKNIAAVSTGTDYNTKVVVLSFPEGKIIKEFANPENEFYSMPRWSDDGKSIVILKTSPKGRKIVLLDFNSGEEKDVTLYSEENVGYPVKFGNYVLFNSPVTGIDNIFAIDLATNTRYQVTESKYGAYNPAVSRDGTTLYYNDQSRDGLDVAHTLFNPAMWKASTVTEQNNASYQHLVEQEGHPNLTGQVPQQQRPVAGYSKLKGIINPYSWGFYADNTLARANIGITSQDIISTTKLTAGYTFDINERTAAWKATASYQALLAIIDVSGSLSNRSVNEGNAYFYKYANGKYTSELKQVKFNWQEQTVQGGLRIPLTLTQSRFATNVTVANSVGLTRILKFENSVNGGGRSIPTGITSDTLAQRNYNFFDYADEGHLVFNNASLSAYRLMKRSRRDINSKWGQKLTVEHYSTPFGGNYQGALLAVTGIGYFPGLFRHHSLWGYAAFQTTQATHQPDNYIFRNQIPLPRGLSLGRFEQFTTLSANYTLPVWYPDIAIGPLLNIQRLRANVFYDYGFGSRRTGTDYSKEYAIKDPKFYPLTAWYASTGIEAKVDFNVMRFLPQLNLGVRYSYGIQPSATRFEVLVGAINF
jgi:hypothetical protein